MDTEQAKEIVIAPLRNTSSLQLAPESKEFSEIARRQLESLTKTGKKPRNKPSVDTSPMITTVVAASQPAIKIEQNKLKLTEITVISPPSKSSLTSSIVSKAEIETEIRNKVSSSQLHHHHLGSTEIPHEILMADLETSVCDMGNEQEPQLHDQELIAILEGKNDEIELIVQSSTSSAVDDVRYIDEIEVMEDETKRLEREIALQQITSIAPRKNKRSYLEPATPGAVRKLEQMKQSKNLVDVLAADWTDEEVVYEVVNIPAEPAKESNIKILNMKVIQEPSSAATVPKKHIKTVTMPTVVPKLAGSPKILNINASPTEPAASFKRARIVKKKEIFDPSSSSQIKPKELPVQLPASITIKKVTKQTIAEQQEKSTARGKRGKRSEIDKLLGDEGAVKMIYSLERENNNQDVPEIEVKPNDESLIDKSEEKNSLITRANAIKNAVMKKSVSPPETAKATGRARKRDSTPVKTPEEKKPVRQAPKPAALKKKKEEESWDYVYASRPAQTTCDDAMIIRRRSNSSYSSSAASPRRQSFDVESPRKDNAKESSSFEFTKPPEKNDSKAPADFFKKDFVEELRGKISDVINGEKSLQAAVAPAKGRKRGAAAVEVASSPPKRASRANGTDQKLLKVEKTGNIAKLTFAQSSLSIQLMNELRSVLNQLEMDECQIVIVKSSEDGCAGLNYKTLIAATADKRKQSASELLTALKSFLVTLAAFPKTLIGCFAGKISGLAVSMLPLFDLVFADPKATFALSQPKLGSIPEGISILKFSGKVQINALQRMIYLDEALDAKTAMDFGLVTKIISSDKELKTQCDKLSSSSAEALEYTKNLINSDFLGSIEGLLTKEVKALQGFWTSPECQEKLKKLA